MNLSVNTATFRTRSSEFKGYRGRMALYESSLTLVALNLNDRIWQNCGVSAQIKRACRQIDEHMADLAIFGDAILDIKNQYDETEKKVCDAQSSRILQDEVPPGILKVLGQLGLDHDLLWKLMKEGGVIGAAMGLVGSVITGAVPDGFHLDDGFNLLKGISKLTGNTAKAFSSAGKGFDIKALFGLNSGTPEDFVTMVKKQFPTTGAKSTADKVAAGAKWAGYAFTVLLEGYDNFANDTEGNSFGRKVAETIGESSIKIAEGAAIAAIVGTLIGGAPVIVVGGVAVVATWGVDALLDHIVGDDWVEATSDRILDAAEGVGEWIGDKAEDAYDWAQNTARDVGEAIGNCGKTVAKWFGNLL